MPISPPEISMYDGWDRPRYDFDITGELTVRELTEFLTRELGPDEPVVLAVTMTDGATLPLVGASILPTVGHGGSLHVNLSDVVELGDEYRDD